MKILILCTVALLNNQVSSRSIDATPGRRRRSDDPAALQAVVDGLLQRVGQLEAQTTATQNDVGQLKTKRCETGTSSLMSPHEQTGHRHTVHINFAHPFATKPWVAVSLSTIDELSTVNLRIGCGSSNVGTTGFDLFVFEWADTHIYGATVSWIACTV